LSNTAFQICVVSISNCCVSLHPKHKKLPCSTHPVAFVVLLPLCTVPQLLLFFTYTLQKYANPQNLQRFVFFRFPERMEPYPVSDQRYSGSCSLFSWIPVPEPENHDVLSVSPILFQVHFPPRGAAYKHPVL